MTRADLITVLQMVGAIWAVALILSLITVITSEKLK